MKKKKKLQEFSQEFKNGFLGGVASLSQNVPEIMIKEEVNKVINLPVDKAFEKIKKINKKMVDKKATLGELLIAKKIIELIDIKNPKEKK